jgi:hypothetical protein
MYLQQTTQKFADIDPRSERHLAAMIGYITVGSCLSAKTYVKKKSSRETGGRSGLKLLPQDREQCYTIGKTVTNVQVPYAGNFLTS